MAYYPVLFVVSLNLLYLVFSQSNTTFGPPNILFIWFDDLGFADVDYNGGPYLTPYLNEWSMSNVIKLNFHYCEQVCSASRSALLTGRYSWRSGLNTVTTQLSHLHFDPSLTLYPELLQDAGYNNYIAGKWHVGYKYEDVCPHKRGFMNGTYGHTGTQYYNRGFRRSFDIYDEQFPCTTDTRKNKKICRKRTRNFKPQQRMPTHDTWTITNGEEVAIHIGDERYSEEIFTEGIIDFINVQDNDIAPFYIQYNLFTPHSSLVEPPVYNTNGSIIDYSICNDSDLLAAKQLFCRQMLYAQIKIEEIFDTLRENEMWDNSFIVITSDNGAAPISESGIAFGQTLPLRGTKSGPHEGGIRTPAMIKGGYINRLLEEMNITSCDYDGLFHISDWYQVLMQVANITHDNVDSDHDLEIWDDIRCKCDPKCRGSPQDDAEDRNELIMMRMCGNRSSVWPNGKYYYSAYYREGDWKLVVNGSYSITDPCPPNENSTGLVDKNIYMGYGNVSIYPTPNQSFFDDVYLPQFDANYDRAVNLYQSLCLEALDNTTIIDQRNNTLFRYSTFMLFNVSADKIEACNVAQFYPEIVADLFDKLQERSFDYNVDEDSAASPGALYTQVDTWDCVHETTYLVPWEGKREGICGAAGRENISARECNDIWDLLNDHFGACRRRRLGEQEEEEEEEDYDDVHDYNSLMFNAIGFCIGVVILLLIIQFVSKYMEKRKIGFSIFSKEVDVDGIATTP